MPVIDTTTKIILADAKPPRGCDSPDCPRRSYRGIKTKKCAKCSHVRYCSRECQVAHWPVHKLHCKSQIMDIGQFMLDHKSVFRWACEQAFADPTIKTSTHGINAYVFRADCLDGPVNGPFKILAPEMIPLEKISQMAGGFQLYGDEDRATNQEIISNGGTGLAMFTLTVMPAREVEKVGVFLRVQRFALDGRSLRSAVPGWQKIVQGLVNGESSAAQLSNAIMGSEVS